MVHEVNSDGVDCIVICRCSSSSRAVGSVSSPCSVHQWKQTPVSVGHAISVFSLSSSVVAEAHEGRQQPGSDELTFSSYCCKYCKSFFRIFDTWFMMVRVCSHYLQQMLVRFLPVESPWTQKCLTVMFFGVAVVAYVGDAFYILRES